MDALILYGSRYGSARRYAEALSQKSGIPALPFDRAKELAGLHTLVYIGGLYAGGVLGLKKALRSLRTDGDFRLLLATVGVCDPALPENRENIRASLQKQLPPALFALTRLFHLRGALDYAALSMGHRAALTLLKRSLERTPRERWSAEDREFFETYGKSVDFVDPDALLPLLKELKR